MQTEDYYNKEETSSKVSFFKKYKRSILFTYLLLLLFSIYKIIEIEYINEKVDIEKINTNYIVDNFEENMKLEKVAIQYFDEKNFSEALKLFTQLSNKNMTISIYYLGLIYEKGYGVDIDLQRAAILYKRSTLQGFYSPLVRLRNLIIKDENILNDGTPLSKALRNVTLDWNKENILELLKFYDTKNITTISNDFHYEFGKGCFIDLMNNPQRLDPVIKEIETFDNQINIK